MSMLNMVVGRWGGLSTGPDSAETLGCLKRSGIRSLEGLGILESGGCGGLQCKHYCHYISAKFRGLQ